MTKIRLYELAKQLKLEPKKVIEDARRMGIDVHVPSNSVSEKEAELIRSKYFAKKEEAPRPKVILKKKVHTEDAAAQPVPVETEAAPLEEEPTARPERLEPEPEPTPMMRTVQLQKKKVKPLEPAAEPVPASPIPPPVRVTMLRPVQAPVQPAVQPAMQASVQPSVQPPLPPPPPPPVIEASPPAAAAASAAKPAEIIVEPESEKAKAKAAARTQVKILRPSAAVQSQTTPAPVDLSQTVYVPPRDDRRRRGRRPLRPTVVKRDAALDEAQVSPLPKRVIKELQPIKLMEGTTVKEFSEKLEIKARDVVRMLLQRGIMATINQTLDADVAKDVGKELGYEVHFAPFEEIVEEAEIEKLIRAGEEEELVPRAPVVTVMGHVDHGKTSLLDAIRQTRVAESEAGGITQHIGAYTVRVPDPDDPSRQREIVFLDTPGHEAFTKMRARGAKVTDIVVLVVAADDGVMPQTVEAIEHAKAAGVQIVVAINKIDKPEANVDRVKRELADHGLVWDGWGGSTVMVEVSAKKRINLDGLLEMIILTADLLELKANPTRSAIGVVLESKLDRGRGPVATILVEQGALRVGDHFLVGATHGRVRAMFDHRGRLVEIAGPATPVEVIGLENVPEAGDKLVAVDDLGTAQRISSMRQAQQRLARARSTAATSLEQLYEKLQRGELKELQLILKADVQGSLEALRQTLEKSSSDKVSIRVIRSGVGAITESDVLLAAASNQMDRTAIIIGFNVRPETRAQDLARQETVDIRFHSIIYKVEEEIRDAMLGLLEPKEREVRLGGAQVRNVFHISKVGNVAGCMVTDGLIRRNARVRLLRDNVVIHEGLIQSLKRFKEDAGEVRQGFECGIALEKFDDVKPGDIIEAFTMETVKPTL
jgi:translation initiation factor IF-2